MKRVGYILTLLTLFSACSVQEDRGGCPVTVRFAEGVNPYGCDSYAGLLLTDRDGRVSREDGIPVSGLSGNGFKMRAAKGNASISVIAGASTASTGDDEVIYTDGIQPDPVFALSEAFFTNAGDEEYVVTSPLCRQVAPVHMTISNPDGSPNTFDMIVKGEWNGFDRHTLAPLRGPHSFRIVSEDGGMSYDYLLPRQGDASLVLALSQNGIHLCDYPLGAGIAASGYDWNAGHLEKLDIEVNYWRNEFSVKVRDWTDVCIVEIGF